MPNQDYTGPTGMGPRSGKGLGLCGAGRNAGQAVKRTPATRVGGWRRRRNVKPAGQAPQRQQGGFGIQRRNRGYGPDVM